MPAALIARNRSEYGQAAVDVYTPLHFGLGFAAGVIGVSPIKAALFFTVLKIGVASLEHGMGHALLRRVPGESNLNELGDLLAEIAGIASGARVRTRWNPNPTVPCVCPTCQTCPASPSPAPAPSALPSAAVSGIFER